MFVIFLVPYLFSWLFCCKADLFVCETVWSKVIDRVRVGVSLPITACSIVSRCYNYLHTHLPPAMPATMRSVFPQPFKTAKEVFPKTPILLHRFSSFTVGPAGSSSGRGGGGARSCSERRQARFQDEGGENPRCLEYQVGHHDSDGNDGARHSWLGGTGVVIYS